MNAIWPMVQAFFVLLAVAILVIAAVAYYRSNRRAIAQDARDQSAPRYWKFVNAYGPQQAEAPDALTYQEALSFLKNVVGFPFVRADRERGIIFFDGRNSGGH